MKRQALAFLTLVTPLFLWSGCSSLPKICEPQNARQTGFGLAMRGEAIAYGNGDVCLDEHRATFRQNFEAGYQEGRARYCDAAEVERNANAKGSVGEAGSFQKERYAICDSTAELSAAFKRGQTAGLAEFCKEERIVADGLAQGERGLEKTFPQEKYAVCGSGRISRLKSVYAKGFKEGNAKFCRADAVGDDGLRDGGQGREALLTDNFFRACSEGDRKKISKRYFEGYNSALMQFCTQSNIEIAARENAESSATASLPAKFTTCFNRFPEQKAQYESSFGDERQRVIESRCTYQGGMETGGRDAHAGNEKKTSLPFFCNQTLYNTFLQGYLEGWKNAKVQLCNPSEAYSEGVRRGQRSSALQENYTPPNLCPSEYGMNMSQKFSEGFQYAHNLAAQQQLAQPSQPGAQFSGGEFECKTQVTNRSGTYDYSRCNESPAGKIACFSDVRETCRHKTTGTTQVRTSQNFDGRCVGSYSACW